MEDYNRKINVLFISDLTIWGGSSHSLVNLISSLPSNITPHVLLSGKGEVFDCLNGMGVDCVIKKFVLNIVFYRWKIKSFIRVFIHYLNYLVYNFICVQFITKKFKGKIDIVHSNTSAIPIGVRIARNLGVKHVWHIREFIDMFQNVKIVGGRNHLKNRILSSDSVICISSPLVSHWQLNKKNNVFVLWNAVRHREDVVYNPIKKNYFLFCCGFLNDFKGADYATRAFCKSGLGIHFKLLFIGAYEEDYKNKLLLMAKEYGIDASLEFLGFQNENAIRELMANATAFLQCSAIEGLGRTVIEAMFYGCPVIARNNGGTTDFVIDGKNGFLFDDEEELIKKMIFVVSNDVSKIIQEAQKTAQDGFSIEDYGERLDHIYKCVLK